MAEYFAADGWDDITVAFPVNILEIKRISKLASNITLNLLAESEDTLAFLEEHLQSPVNIFLKIDVGYHRTGISPEKRDVIEGLIHRLISSTHLKFKGFLAHAGHSYNARARQEIAKIHESSLEILKTLKQAYIPQFPDIIISTGDTPTCSVMENFEGIDEIRPGNFVFYDLTQHHIGSCQLKDIAVAMACPVVAKHYDRNELIVYGGGVHFSKDRLAVSDDRGIINGKVVHLNQQGWELTEGDENYVSKLSQEHGTIKATQQVLDQYQIGDLVGVLPVHSCMTANLMKRYLTFEGEWISRL